MEFFLHWGIPTFTGIKIVEIVGEILKDAILEDKANGRIQFFSSGCFGSTGMATADDNVSIGPICKKYGLRFHTNAAWDLNDIRTIAALW